MLFYLKQPIIPPPQMNMTVRVVNASIPVSFTNINSSNNKLVIDSTTYNLTSGSYNALTLTQHLNEVLGGSLTCAYDSITNKYTFTGMTNFTVRSSSTCLGVLGLPEGQDTSSTDYELTSPYSADLSGDNCVYISCPSLLTTNLSSSTGGINTSIIRSILVDVPSGGIVFDRGADSFITTQEDHLSFLHVNILGEDMVTCVDFQNTNWNMTIEVGFVPKENQPTLASTRFEDLYTRYIERLHDTTKSQG